MKKIMIAGVLSLMSLYAHAENNWCNVSPDTKGKPIYTLAAFDCDDNAKQQAMLDGLNSMGLKILNSEDVFKKATKNEIAAEKEFKAKGQLIALRVKAIESETTDNDGVSHVVMEGYHSNDRYSVGIIKADVMLSPNAEMIEKVPYVEKSAKKVAKFVDSFDGTDHNVWVNLFCAKVDYSYKYLKFESCVFIGMNQ